MTLWGRAYVSRSRTRARGGERGYWSSREGLATKGRAEARGECVKEGCRKSCFILFHYYPRETPPGTCACAWACLSLARRSRRAACARSFLPAFPRAVADRREKKRMRASDVNRHKLWPASSHSAPRNGAGRAPRGEKWPRSSAKMMCETHAKTRARAPRGAAGRGLRSPPGKHLCFNAFILSSSLPTGDSSRGMCFHVCVWVHVGCVCDG